MHMLFQQQFEEIFIGHEFSCVVISNICVSSQFYDTFKLSHMYDTLLILIFCKNVLCHIRRTGDRCAIFVECTAYCCDELLFRY